ncbi:MAG: hypothetical protein ABI840_01245 [bacterium]
MKKFFVIFFTLLIYNLAKGSCDTCRMNVGMNLYSNVYWGSENPFVDIMKFSKTWGTQNIVFVNGGQNPWNSGVIGSIQKDSLGYPLQLPYYMPGIGLDTSQAVYTSWENTGTLPAGQYIVLYDGSGEIQFLCDAIILSQTTGRIVVNVTPGICNQMQLKILRSTFGNHIRNIRFLMPGTEFTYQSHPYNQAWFNKLKPFKTIRFMDWGSTNDNPNISWSNRAKKDYYTWTTKSGVPYEEMIRLCNTMNANMWINIPHQADDNYIIQMSRLVRDSLNPNLKIYVEYSNEIWNPIFTQSTYLYNNGNQNEPWPERAVPFIQNALDRWSAEFTAQRNRIIRVVGIAVLFQDLSERICYSINSSSFDAIATAAYFAFTPYGYNVLQSLGASATINDVKQLARNARDSLFYTFIKNNKIIADDLDKKFIFYEAGQHLTPYPFGSIQPYNQALVDVQSDSSMYNMYNEWFAELRAVSNDLLFMHYAFAAPKNGQSGSWGALESTNQNPPFYVNAPKYQALLDNMIEFKSLTLTVLIEGYYNNVNNTSVGDTITVYLHNINYPYSIIDSSSAYIDIYGTATFVFSKPENGAHYYIHISHRNSIETWSKSGGEEFISSNLNYNFSTSQTQAYGNNLTLKGSRYCLYSGDVSQDGVIDINDAGLIDNDAYNFLSGYVATDLTGDDIVDVSDMSIADNNAFNFVGKIIP